MNSRTRALLLTVTTTLALAAGVLAPAGAETATYGDPADMGGASLNDLRRVTVDHSPERLSMRVGFVDLRRRSDGGPASLTILIDTRTARRGPELRLTTGLYAGTDYQLMKVRNGRPVGDPLGCAHRVRLDYAADVLRFRASHSCLGEPTRARVGVKMTDEYDGSHPVTDWLGERRSFTPWVAAS